MGVAVNVGPVAVTSIKRRYVICHSNELRKE
jgi:hypothetical protein